MSKYFNQSELLIITILLLLLDMNGFCNMITEKVPYGNKNIGVFIIFVLIVTILFDLYIIDYVANMKDYNDQSTYAVNSNITSQVNLTAYKNAAIIVFNYISFIILFIVGSCIFSNILLRIKHSNYSSVLAMSIFLVPLTLVSSGICSFANFYRLRQI